MENFFEKNVLKNKRVDIYTYMPVFRELLGAGKEISFTVTGNSMSPFLVHGRDAVVLKKPEGGWKKGDIALFQRVSSQYILHRICRVNEDGNCFFIGDGQQCMEGPIAPEQIFGKVVAVRRKEKWEKPGTFWWEFFEHVWLHIIPLRPFCRNIYGLITRREQKGQGRIR